MTELKPCPFCGSKAEVYRYSGADFSSAYVMCTGCQIGTLRQRREVAIECWNKRVKE